MNILLIILSQFVLIEAGNQNSRPLPNHNRLHYDCTIPRSNPASLPPEHLNIRIRRQCRMIENVNLRKVKRVLANEHLPIWILRGQVLSSSSNTGSGDELQRNYEVMEQLGGFTAYHDASTSSAAVYFHKRREFDGMINCEFIIRRFSIDHICRATKASFLLGRFGLYRRLDYEGHRFNDVLEDYAVRVNDQTQMKTYGGYVYEGYPEVLVIVSWDVAQFWIQKVPKRKWYTTIISHILTLFNGIDMLYSKVKETNIQINIAGVIIGMDADSFLFLRNCYVQDVTSNESSNYKLNGGCVNRVFRSYLGERKNKIPIDSYDLVIFLTRQHIFQVRSDDSVDEGLLFEPIAGISSVMFGLYDNQKHDVQTILVATISLVNQMESYPTIAHEIAHLMTVRHDTPPFFTDDGECCAGIMKGIGEFCVRCLSWSATSEESFRLFFSSPNCCRFINKPRSLNPPGRYEMITADEQCRCYGYKSARKYEQIPYTFCDFYLECSGEDDEIHRTGIPMDGTICDDKRVCHQRVCEEIGSFETSPSSE